jgi:hypothetical protein
MSSRNMCLLPRATLHSDSEHLQNGTDPKWYIVVKGYMLQTVPYKTVQPYKMVQVQNGTGSKWYIVVNRYMLKNSTLQNGTVTKRYTDILVCYITVFYSHNQQGSTNPWIGWALSLTLTNYG